MNRQDILTSLKSHSPAVLIVGGGINGVGTFRDLTLQGVDTLLVDRGDFCSGASAASSRMAHGGIRYLENGEFRLVREAVQERNRMIQNAPSLVQPLPTTIPIFKIFSGLLNAPLKFLGWLEKPSERGGLIIKVGLIFYDAFTGKTRAVPCHVFDGHASALKKYPRLNPGIRYAATYYDGIILSPERLTLELLLDAEKEGDHARSLNYVSLVSVNGDKVALKDEVTGQTFDISPRLIVNAAGPWIDGTNRTLGLPTHYVGPTKGSHLVLDNPELREAIGDHEFFFENKDGRIVLIFPLFDKVMIGTSDLPIEDPDSARCTEEEVDYFIEMVGRVFPGIKVSREQIVFRFSGVRPLAYTKAKNAGQITRDHHIQEDKLGNIPVYSLVGGKWTSFRAFSEQVTDRALAFLEMPRKADTKSLPIGAGKDAAPIKIDPHYTRGEIAAMAKREKIVHLDDLLLRRTLLGYLGQLTRPLVEELANALGDTLGWDGLRKKTEVERAIKILADRHGVQL
ncbi:MAG: glycerol-3-phosphate dehydrogenase/oxidase [Candidatus Atribacteria bacterium]|nr:glycerol-3-phosphate dehydrogenase/oxidase [Candidatus Atribacteria bacterium]